MTSSVSTDIERIILEIEFENQQYVKQIEKERQEIENLEKQEQLLTLEVKREEELTPTLDASTKSLHKQFTQNRDNIQSLKKTVEVLDDHEKALSNKFKSMKLQAQEDREEREKMLAHYQNIWDDYKACYETFPKVSELKKKMEGLEETQKLHDEAFEKWQNVTKELESVKTEAEKKFVPYTNLNSFIVKVAEMYVTYKKTEQDVRNTEVKYSEEMCRLQKIREQLHQQELKRKEEERQKVLLAESNAREAQMEEDKRRCSAEVQNKNIESEISNTQNDSLMQHAQFNLSTPKMAFSVMQLPKLVQPSNKMGRKPCLTLPSPVITSRSKVHTLQMNNGGQLSFAQSINSPQHAADVGSETLLRQVQEMQLQRKMEMLNKSDDQRELVQPQLDIPQSRYTASTVSRHSSMPANMTPSEISTKRQIPENLALCSPMHNKPCIEQPKIQKIPKLSQQHQIVRTPSRPRQQQESSVSRSDFVQKAGVANDSKTPENTPGRPDCTKTPGLYMSPTHDADSTFDVDKFMERAKMYASKSPGVASVFKKRPMFGSKNTEKDKDTSPKVTTDNAGFDGLGLLNSANSYFNGSGDGPSVNYEKSTESGHRGASDNSAVESFSFNFGTEKNTSATDCNLTSALDYLKSSSTGNAGLISNPTELELGGAGDNSAAESFSFNFGAEKNTSETACNSASALDYLKSSSTGNAEKSTEIGLGGAGDNSAGESFIFNFGAEKNTPGTDHKSWDFKFGDKNETDPLFNFDDKLDKGLGDFGFQASALSMLDSGDKGSSADNSTNFNFNFKDSGSRKGRQSGSEPMKLF